MSRVYTAESSIYSTGVFSSPQSSPGEIILKINDSGALTDADSIKSAKRQEAERIIAALRKTQPARSSTGPGSSTRPDVSCEPECR